MKTGRYHHIFDLEKCDARINDLAHVEAFIKEAASAIGMTIIGGPLVVEGVPENPGVTGIAVVDYSHISVHTFTEHDEVLVDIFSCKPYDKVRALEVCKQYFAGPDTFVRNQEVFWG